MTHPYRPETDKELNQFKFNKTLDAFYALCGIWKAYMILDGLDEDGKTIKIKENVNYIINPTDSFDNSFSPTYSFHDTYYSEPDKINGVATEITNHLLSMIPETDNIEELQHLESLLRRLKFEKPDQKNFIEQKEHILSSIRSRIDTLERVGKLQRIFRNSIQWIKDRF